MPSLTAPISTTLSIFSASSVRCRQWHYAIHVILFVLFAAILYRFIPRFLPQNLDSQDFYYVTTSGFQWRESWLDTVVFTPLDGMGSILWPLMPAFIPYIWPFALRLDPIWQLYLSQIALAASFYISTLYFYATVRVPPGLAVAASWLSFVLVMIYGLSAITAPDTLQPIVLTYFCLALFVETGQRQSVFGNLVCFALFQVCFIAFTLGVPSWHIIAMPFFCCIAFFYVIKGRGWHDRFWKLGTGVAAFAGQISLGSYQSMFYTLVDTIRVTGADLYPEFGHSRYLAGYFFGSTVFEVALIAAFFFGVGTAWRFASHEWPERMATLYWATVVFSAVIILWSLVFLYAPIPSIGPKPRYMQQPALPLIALFAVFGLQQVATWTRRSSLHRREVAVGLGLVATFFLWQLLVTPDAWKVIGIAGLIGGMLYGLVRLKLQRFAIALCAGLVGWSMYVWLETAFGGGADDRFDGRARMGLVTNPIIEFLRERVALKPDSVFAGYADDYYREIDNHDLTDRIVHDWSSHWHRHGNGMKLFAWSAMDIPTITQFSPYITPLYGLIIVRLLDAFDDLQGVNALTITRPDLKILGLLGLRYLVTDAPLEQSEPATEVSRWEQFHIYELAQANLASYSPTEAISVSDAETALTLLATPSFDPTRIAIVGPGARWPDDTVTASPARLTFVRGGFKVEATSTGRSILVLPIQFSNCLVPQIVAGDATAHLMRIDLALTGLVFDRAVEINVQYRQWPRAPATCQALDHQEITQLLK